MRWLLVGAFVCAPLLAYGHNVSADDIERVANGGGPQPVLYAYLGAKHMVTGLDHLLFLAGVMFLLSRVRDVITLATLFALGHTVTLLAGTYWQLGVNPYLVDAVIGLSVTYKAVDNLGWIRRAIGFRPPDTVAVFAFGLVHGLGLATKLLDLGLSEDGLITNLLAFNVGVELGQLVGLSLILILLGWLVYLGWRKRTTIPVNLMLALAGVVLCAVQVQGYLAS